MMMLVRGSEWMCKKENLTWRPLWLKERYIPRIISRLIPAIS